MADIFISYSSKDARFTDDLVRHLEAAGYSTWWGAGLTAAQELSAVIERELHDAKAVIVIWSKGSVTSRWVRAEASLADSLNKLITVHDSALERDQIPLPYSTRNSAPATGYAQILSELAARGIAPSGNRNASPNAANLSGKARIAQAIVNYDREDFRALIELSGLDPSKHLRFWDWSGLNFERADLRGYDFTGALLCNCRFRGARILGARFDRADLRGSNLRDARDWLEFVAAWMPDPNAPSEDHLPVGAVFQDAPFGPEMVAVPAGRFMMGSPPDEPERRDGEGPQHEVTISKRFAIGRFAVTFEEWDFAQGDKDWKAVTGRPPREPDDYGWGRADRAVIDVSWDDAEAYMKWLSHKTGRNYRLPSEAEWEYACRAGRATPFWWGNTIAPGQANYDGRHPYDGGQKGEYQRRTLPVKSFEPNPWGLYQVHGNVWEWCADGRRNYTDEPVTDPVGSLDIASRALRGGSWRDDAGFARAAFRLECVRGNGSRLIGFRCCA
jgi:formylglycine-generating enzyme required for sulfatase activity